MAGPQGSVTLVFLGPLADRAGTASRTLPAPLDWAGLLASLEPALAKEIAEPRVHVACAGKVLGDKTALLAKGGDEVALLPPVSGG